MKIKNLVLASGSPRRVELLTSLKVEFAQVSPDIDESILKDETPLEYGMRLSTEKARKGADDYGKGRSEAVFIGADTIVVLSGRILGKPMDKREAAEMLRTLSGKTHSVITAFAIFDPATGNSIQRAIESKVTFKEISEADIVDYIATGEPMDKAGAYAVQGIGAKMIDRVEGSYTNVVGLPVEELEEVLRENYPTALPKSPEPRPCP